MNRGTAASAKARAARMAAPLAAKDPVTADREYDADEVEWLAAMQEYQRSTGRKFPTWCEVLAVLKGLGYGKQGRG